MLTLSVRQPWAWLIVNGFKTVENRSWATDYRGPLLIHAGKTLDLSPRDMAGLRRDLRPTGIIIPAELPLGGIVGMVDLVDCVTACADPGDADWHEPGMIAWVLRDSRPLPFRAMPGRLRLFEVHLIAP